jgi:hypothetical protein
MRLHTAAKFFAEPFNCVRGAQSLPIGLHMGSIARGYPGAGEPFDDTASLESLEWMEPVSAVLRAIAARGLIS